MKSLIHRNETMKDKINIYPKKRWQQYGIIAVAVLGIVYRQVSRCPNDIHMYVQQRVNEISNGNG